MADWTFTNLTTAVVGIATTTAFIEQVQSTGNVSLTNGTKRQNLTLDDAAIPSATRQGWLSGNRPQVGQVYPRYNK